MKVIFSVLSYKPYDVSGEQINVGILFHILDINKIEFKTTSNWKRLENFDDEIDIECFKLIIKGIDKHLKRVFKENESTFKLDNYIKRYNNELKFTKPMMKNVDNIQDFIEDTKKIFLRYDYEKKNRPNSKKQKDYIRDLLKANDIEYTTKEVYGTYNDKIQYDYIIGNHGFKSFVFEGKKINNMVRDARNWAFIANEMRNDYKTTFVCDIDANEGMKTVIDILRSSDADIITVDNLMELLQKIGYVGYGQLKID